MSEWTESTDEPGSWRMTAGLLELAVDDYGENGAVARVLSDRRLLWSDGACRFGLTVEQAKAAAVAKAREFARGIEAALPPAPNVFGDCSGPFISRCQACMVKHWPHCEGAAP